jgi:Zn-dependent protease
MRWSLSLGSIGGTAIRIHVTFLLFLIWLGAIYYRQGGAEAAWQGTIFIVLIFLCVLLHELGHVFAARYYGVPTRDVTLWPFGGIASMERMPDKPSQELIVALAGPAVNVVIAAGLLLWLGARLDPQNLTQIENPAVSMAAKVAGANIILVLFNMIPAFPMDGGRVLRALLWWRSHDFVKATRRAAIVSRVVGYVFIGLGLYQLLAGAGFGGLWLAFIGWMLLQAARVSVQQAQLERGLAGVTAGRLATAPATWLPPYITLSAAARDYFTAQREHCLPVEAEREGEAYDGALCITDFQRTPRPEWDSARARDAMTKAEAIPTVSPGTPAWDAVRLLAERGVTQVAVVEAGRLLGFVDQEGTFRFLQRRRALGAPGV